MSMKINENAMSAEVDGAVIATATRTGDRWTARNWPHTLPRDQAITALMIAEYQTRPPVPTDAPTLEEAGRTRYRAGSSQRASSRDLNIDRRKVRRIIEQSA
jgi:hypothetical protein